MMALQFKSQCSTALRQGIVGAFMIGSLFWVIQPVFAHGESGGDGSMPDTSGGTGPKVVVYRSASCGCCIKWGSHIASAGFRLDDRITEDMKTVKKARGINSNQASCHTAVVKGYVIEGHVPASAIKRLLKEKPNIRGLAVPGMPIGSPGMEMAGVEPENYVVLAIAHDGTTSVFARY